MSHNAWLEQFKDRLSGFEDLHRSSGSPLSLLAYAFEQQSISYEEYLSWAMSYYEVPHLQNRFFTEASNPQKSFAKWASHYTWSQDCVPVGEWDNSLIVACLQPPENFPTNPQAIFVLASFEALQDYWNNNFANSNGVEMTAAAPLVALKTASLPANPPTDFSFENLEIDSQPTKIQASETEDLLEFNDDFLSTGNPLQPAEVPEKMEGLSDAFTVTHLNAKPADVNAEMPTTISPPPAMAEEKTQFTPPVFVDEDSFANKPHPLKTQSATPVAQSLPKSKPAKPPVAGGDLALERWNKKYGAQLGESVQSVLKQMKNHFEKSLILTLDDNETQLAAFAWDEEFAGVVHTDKRIPLGTPSIFNIVASTQKTFHGYISINEVNEKFFEDWNHGMIPDHVTLAPILLKDKVVGMLMGFGEKSAYNKMALNTTEKLASELSQNLTSLKVA